MTTATEPSHTPTPWAIVDQSHDEFAGHLYVFGNVTEAAGYTRAGFGAPEVAKANAEFIVRCVNAHDRLVKALEDLLDDFENRVPVVVDSDLAKMGLVHAALELAKGTP